MRQEVPGVRELSARTGAGDAGTVRVTALRRFGRQVLPCRARSARPGHHEGGATAIGLASVLLDRVVMRVVIVVGFLVACGDGRSPAPDAVAMPDAAAANLFPTPPTSARFMWPGVQEEFHRSDGSTCIGRVTAAVGDRAVCYVGADDEVHCAGAVYTRTFGSTFTPIGRTGVDQIVFTPTVNSATGNAMCIHELDGTAHCMGDYNSHGAFADGTTSPSDTFVPWSTLTTISRLDSNWETRCALAGAGEVYCAGFNVGAMAVRQDTDGGHRSVFIDRAGQIVIDDPAVFRVANGSPCSIEADGLHCLAPGADMLSGTPGDVVDGTVSQPLDGPMPDAMPVCWLDSRGRVFCGVAGIKEQRFADAPPILALAGNFYTATRCAVANDGSLWCVGNNAYGELGTGTTAPVRVDTMVQPPGSVKIACE